MTNSRHQSLDAAAPLDFADLSDRLHEVESELRVVYCACDGPALIEGALENGVMRVLARQIRTVREIKNAVDPPKEDGR